MFVVIATILSLILIILLTLLIINHLIQSTAFGARGDSSARVRHRSYKYYSDLRAKKISCKSNMGQKLNGYIYKNINNKEIKGLIVFFHGYSSGQNAYIDYFYELTKGGYDILAFDFTASCLSEGRKIKSLAQGDIDSRYIYDFVISLEEYKDKKIYSMGHSWGGHVSTTFASEHQDRISKCVTFAPFDSVDNLYLSIMPSLWIIKPLFILLNRFSYKNKDIKSAVKNLKNIKIPTLYMSGDNDKIINKKYGLNLFIKKVNNVNVEKCVLKGLGHFPTLTADAQKYMDDKFNISFVPKRKKRKHVFSYKGLDVDYEKMNEIDQNMLKKVFNFLNEQ